MIEPQSTTQIIFPQAIETITSQWHAKIEIDRINADALSGYGRREVWAVSVFVFSDVCDKCGESALHEGHSAFPRHRHRWKQNRPICVVYAHGLTLPLVMEDAEKKAQAFLSLH